MKTIALYILTFVLITPITQASFLYEEIDPICSISGKTHTAFPWEISDTSSWEIPKAYDGECETTPSLSASEQNRIYKVMTRYLAGNDYIDEVSGGYSANTQGREYIKDTFFPVIQRYISTNRNKLSHITILNYAVSIIGYDYYIQSKNISGEYSGLSVESAMELADQNLVPFRVVEEDGEIYAVTMDYRPGRINAVVEDSIVVSYTVE